MAEGDQKPGIAFATRAEINGDAPHNALRIADRTPKSVATAGSKVDVIIGIYLAHEAKRLGVF